MQGVFQDPFSSYNPIFKVDRVFTMIRSGFFPDMAAGDVGRARRRRRSARSASNRGDVLGKYPHQLSGGQLQRLLIARALLLDIRYLVADEIISMLDASTRIDVLNLLGDLKARGLGILFITHDLSLGNYISDRTVILRRGAVVEMGDTEKVYGNPQHPYTRMLLASVPRLHSRLGRRSGARPCRPGRRRSRTCEPQPLVAVERGHFVASAKAKARGGRARRPARRAPTAIRSRYQRKLDFGTRSSVG